MTPPLHAVRPELCYNTEAFPTDDPVEGHYLASHNDEAYSELGQAINTSEALLLDWIKCNHPTDDHTFHSDFLLHFPIFLSSLYLLAAFLIPDVCESFILITKCKGRWETMVGAIIVLKAVIGTSVGIMAILNVVEFKGLSDTFLLVVGLLFIHEVDEEFGYMQEIIERTR